MMQVQTGREQTALLKEIEEGKKAPRKARRKSSPSWKRWRTWCPDQRREESAEG